MLAIKKRFGKKQVTAVIKNNQGKVIMKKPPEGKKFTIDELSEDICVIGFPSKESLESLLLALREKDFLFGMYEQLTDQKIDSVCDNLPKGTWFVIHGRRKLVYAAPKEHFTKSGWYRNCIYVNPDKIIYKERLK